MGNSSSMSKKQKGLIIAACITIILIIILGTLGGIGIFNKSSTNLSPASSVAPASIIDSLISLTNDGKVWTKVFDSMTLSSKCFLDFNNTAKLSPVDLKKIFKYQIDNNMLPVDNPFKDTIDVPVTNCSSDGTRLILTLDLSKYNDINPFKQGDELYIFGIGGETNANTTINSDTQAIVEPRYVYATMNEYPKYLTSVNQIMISSKNPCNYKGECTLDNSLILFSNGTYTGGGTVRFIGNSTMATGFIQQRPSFMFYLYMSYNNYPFTWPLAPITVTQVYKLYSGYYNGYVQWLANLPQTCTQPTNSIVDFVSGSVIVSGGSGTGLQMYTIPMNILGHKLSFFIITNDGTGYTDGDIITVTQGSITANITIYVNKNCVANSANDTVYLSYTTTQQQIKNLINYVMSIDPSINTISFINNTGVTSDNYNNPSIIVSFAKTTPDTTFYSSNYTNILSNQVIYTSDTITIPYDFKNNAAVAIGTSCNN